MRGTLSAFLDRVKRGKVSKGPRDPESWSELRERLAKKGQIALVRRETYFQALRRFRPLVRLLAHFAFIDGDRVHLFWLGYESGRAFARTLPDEMALELAIRCSAPELERHLLAKVGGWKLSELRTGEEFSASSGQRGVVGRRSADQVTVLVYLGRGLDVRQVDLPGDVDVRVGGEVALRILRRRTPGRRAGSKRKVGSHMAANSRNNGQGGERAAQRKQSQPEETPVNKTLPIHEIRAGRVKAAIWANDTEGGGTRYNVTFSRLYTDEAGAWHDSRSFGRDELPLLVLVAQRAFEYIVDPKG